MATSPSLTEGLVDPSPGDPITAEQTALQNAILRRHVAYPDTITDSGGVRMVRRRGTTTPFRIYTCELTEDLLPGSYADATLLVGLVKETEGDAIIVYDEPTSITTGKKIASGTICRVFKDHDMNLASNQYVLLIPFACEVDQ